MSILDFFRTRKAEYKTNIRDVDISTDDSFSPEQILLALSTGSPTSISPREAYFLSERNADLGGAVEKISKAIAQINILTKDVYKEVIENDDLVMLLDEPGESMRSIQFLYEIAESFLLTSEI